jgi:hypothetical protein
MTMIVGGIRALLGIVGAVLGVRRRRTILLERRGQLDEVFREILENLAETRRRFGSEDDPNRPFNWYAWHYGSPLRTCAWRECKAALMTRIDGGPAIDPDLGRQLDALEEEFVTTRYSSNWEARLVDVATHLRDLLDRYPRGRLNRVVMIGTPAPELPGIDAKIRTPQSPAEMQQRAMERVREWAEAASQ